MSLLQKMFGKRQKRTHPYCAALIAAAGSSTRYGGENKLLQTLDGIPVLVRTLLTIDRVEGIDEIVIAAREDELLPYAELCKTFGLRKPVKVIVGGATRTESVLRAALEASPETEFFAVQDGIVERTPDRSALFAVQTPQVFAADLLKAALQSAIAGGATITDDCSAVERMGKEVHLTEGSEENIKITTPVDLAIAEAILQRRGE